MLKRSIQEWLVLAICAVFVVTVVPAAIFRIATADWVLAVIDVVWAGSMAFLFVYTFRTRRTTLPATMMAWIFLALTLSAIHYTGLHQVNWLYPVILAMSNRHCCSVFYRSAGSSHRPTVNSHWRKPQTWPSH